MPLKAESLLLATPLDPAEEPPGSIDPLGTLSAAERLADVLLPGFTARMWRARLLTFTTVSAAIADRVVALMEGCEEVRLEARLAFERLYVSAIVRMHQKDPGNYARARRQLPGTDLARRALNAGEPLTRSNFLKGQAVNGPFGVMARLARNLELVDDEGYLGRNASGLLLTWSEDQDLPGILDDEGPGDRAGAAWAADVTKLVAASVGKNQWPGASHRVWEQLATFLRPDLIGMREQRVLSQLLETGEVRQRMIGILRDSVQIYRNANQGNGRGWVERLVFHEAVKPALRDGPVDRVIDVASLAVEAYETATALLQQAFDGLIWNLKQHGGRAEPDVLLADPRMCTHLERTVRELGNHVPILDRAIDQMRDASSLNLPSLVEPLARLREEAGMTSTSPHALMDTILSRHERVQRERRKSMWIDRESQWTLMPGFGVEGDTPAVYAGTYLHPFRILNTYSMLMDLGQVSVETSDGEE
jgi:hypothetical protein